MNQKRGKLFILSGPSGSGKTTLYKKLLADGQLKNKVIKSISVTTRAPRAGEVYGREYFFVTKDEFEAMRRRREFLESQKVFDNYYGTRKEWVLDRLAEGKSVLLCIDVKGAMVVWKKIPSATRIFITAPSLEELKKRLINRGSEEHLSLKLRLKTAQKELAEAKNYQHIVTNDSVQKAYKNLKNIIKARLK